MTTKCLWPVAALILSSTICAQSQALPPDPGTKTVPGLLLERVLGGNAAIEALGARLPEVAAAHRMSAAELRRVLTDDRTAKLDRHGRLFYTDATPADLAEPGATAPQESTYSTGSIPLDQTFLLHSRPGAAKLIYLDFDGYYLTGTAWNAYTGVSAINAPPWDIDGNPAVFGDTERITIQKVWKRVAESYSAFDVDVTTEYPGEAALTRSSTSDTAYGMRVLVSPISSYFGNYGGISYVGAFDDVGDYYKPALIFPENLANNEKYIGEACSHESGHTVGLSHDGTTTGTEYYAGQGTGETGWAPVMGASYYKNLTQWSKGEYANANNKQDDLAIIAGYLGYRTDDYGSDIATAAVFPPGTQLTAAGTLERNTDRDVFKFTTGAGSVSINVTPADVGPDVDLLISLYDSSGTLVSTSNPSDYLAASINTNLNAGTYYLSVQGTGKGDPLTTGYTAYGCVGQYNVSGSIIDATPTLALAGALDTPGWTWTTGGNTPAWYPQTSLSHDGVDAARSGAIANSQNNWLQTVVTGPGTLTFWWKVSSEAGYDFARFFINGVQQAQRSGEGAWVQASYTLGAGAQTLRWDYIKDPAVIGGSDAVWLDQVSFVPGSAGVTLTVNSVNPASGVAITVSPNDSNGQGSGTTSFTRTYAVNTSVTLTAPATAGANTFQKWQKDGLDLSTSASVSLTMDAAHTLTAVYVTPALTLADALDTPGWTWTTGGNTPAWYPQTSLSHDGVDAARSGAIGNSQNNWIQTVVTGPGTLTFWWKVSSEVGYDFARFFINGVQQAQRSGEGDWVQASYTLGAGAQTLRWDYIKDPAVIGGSDAAWVDQVSFVPGVLALADALDTPGWTWTTGGSTPAWYPQTSLSHDGVDAARSGPIGNSQNNWIETVLTGPGTLTFWWKVSSEAGYDFARFFINGVQQAQRSGEGDWVQASYTLGAGAQTLRWDYIKDPAVIGGSDAAWVDQVSFVPRVLTLADALDTPGWTWTTGGNTPAWYPQTSLSHDGVDAARSGAIGNSQNNWIQTVVTGPGALTFWWKVSSEAGYDFARFFINGVQQAQRSGEGDWVQASYALGAGAQTLRWDYIKDPAVIGGSDAAWVDQVSFAPGAAIMGGTASDATAGHSEKLAIGKAAMAGAVTSSIQLAVRIETREDGRMFLMLSGPANRECRILGSNDLVEWKEIGRVFIGEHGSAEFAEPGSVSAAPCRFYRALVR